MRKIVVPLFVIGLFFVLSAPAPAAEKTVEDRVKALEDTIGSWSFYGSVRYATFYETTSNDAAFKDTGKVTTLATDADMLGSDQKKTLWGLAPNTRIGASVNKDDLGGKYEIGFKDDATLYTRLLYGAYTFDNVTFLAGQDYTPLSPSFCNQAFKGDTGLKEFGQIDETGSRVPQLKVKWNGLQVALVRTNTSYATTRRKRQSTILLPECHYPGCTDRFCKILCGARDRRVRLYERCKRRRPGEGHLCGCQVPG